MRVRVASWNLRSQGPTDSKLDYLETARWDIACLQEVNARTDAALLAKDDWSVVSGLALAGTQLSGWKRPHAAAIVARHGWGLERQGLIPELPTAGRGIHAVASSDDSALAIASWHAPNKAGDGLAAKMAGYRAVIEWIENTEGSVVLALDGNHWNTGISLEAPPTPAPDDPHYVENRFFSRDPQHRLGDTLLTYMRSEPAAHRAALRDRPDGPLALTYRRGRGASQTDDRFDYILASNDFRVENAEHDYDGAVAAGSDHAFLAVDLSW